MTSRLVAQVAQAQLENSWRTSFVFHGSGANQSVGSGPAVPSMARVGARLGLFDDDWGTR